MTNLFISCNLLRLGCLFFFLGITINPALAEGRSPQKVQIQNKSSLPVITPTTPAAKEKMAEGLSFIQRRQIPQAINLFQEAIALDPELWQAHYNLGLAYRQAGELQKAADSFYQTVAIEPRFALGFANIGGILIDVQNWSQAQQYLNQALVLDPNLAITHYNFGLIHQQFGRMDA